MRVTEDVSFQVDIFFLLIVYKLVQNQYTDFYPIFRCSNLTSHKREQRDQESNHSLKNLTELLEDLKGIRQIPRTEMLYLLPCLQHSDKILAVS